MTTKQIKGLIIAREGKLCIRLFRRADGTVLTKDCPIGLQALRKRVSVLTGVSLAAILSLFSISYGQSRGSNSTDGSPVNIERTHTDNQESELTGTVVDSNGAVIPGATIKLYKNRDRKPLKTKSDADGIFSFKSLGGGTYKIDVTASGFKKSIYSAINVVTGETIQLTLSLEVRGESVTVGIYGEEPFD
jgi:hypothetical protein